MGTDGKMEIYTIHYSPIRTWKKLTYVAGERVISERYYADRQVELDRLKEADPALSKTQLEAKLKQTAWFKRYHNSKGELAANRRQYWDLAADDLYVKKELSSEFNSNEIKKEVLEADSYDAEGSLKPMETKWSNPKLEQLRGSNPDMYSLLDTIKEFYYKSQANLPVGMRRTLGEFIPMIEQGVFESVIGNDGKTKVSGKDKLRGLGKALFGKFANAIGDDVNDGNKQLYGQGFDDKHLHMPYLSHIDIEHVSHNVIYTDVC
jgi:hypothetical protein